jgi:hypothetical protein
MLRAVVVHGQARLGERAGEAECRRQRIGTGQTVSAGAGQRGFGLGEFRASGGSTQRGKVRLKQISVRHAGPP